MKVCIIDDMADQTIGLSTDNVGTWGFEIGLGVTVAYKGTEIGVGTTGTYNGYVKGIVTGVSTDSDNSASTIDVKIVSRVKTTGISSPLL